MIDATKAKHVSTVARELAKDIRDDKVQPGHSRLVDGEGLPCCSMGHLLIRAGIPFDRLDNPIVPLSAFIGSPYGSVYRAITWIIGRNDGLDSSYSGRPSAIAHGLENLATALDALGYTP